MRGIVPPLIKKSAKGIGDLELWALLTSGTRGVFYLRYQRQLSWARLTEGHGVSHGRTTKGGDHQHESREGKGKQKEKSICEPQVLTSW